MNRSGSIETSISVHNADIISSKSMKILGIELDSNLNFNDHVKNICIKSAYQINALKRVGKYLTIEGRLEIYKAFVRSNFSYCPLIWLFCGKRNSQKLEKLQERVLRFVYNDNETVYNELLLRANMLSLSMYRLRFLAIEVYKSVSNLNPKFINDMFTERPLKYDLRDSNLVHQPKFKTFKYGYRSFRYYGAKLWNSLPSSLKCEKDIANFKRSLSKWCLSEDAKSLEIF